MSEAEEQGSDRLPFTEHKRGERDKSLSGNDGESNVAVTKKTPAVFREQRAGTCYRYWLITFKSFVFNLYWKTGLPIVP
ncbi:hypothetical protein J31TS2_40890 [Bacillus licheniformis]|nr:hypothetical protein J31TS2_40890 [Bacillus licheniformis]